MAGRCQKCGVYCESVFNLPEQVLCCVCRQIPSGIIKDTKFGEFCLNRWYNEHPMW